MFSERSARLLSDFASLKAYNWDAPPLNELPVEFRNEVREYLEPWDAKQFGRKRRAVRLALSTAFSDTTDVGMPSLRPDAPSGETFGTVGFRRALAAFLGWTDQAEEVPEAFRQFETRGRWTRGEPDDDGEGPLAHAEDEDEEEDDRYVPSEHGGASEGHEELPQPPASVAASHAASSDVRAQYGSPLHMPGDTQSGAAAPIGAATLGLGNASGSITLARSDLADIIRQAAQRGASEAMHQFAKEFGRSGGALGLSVPDAGEVRATLFRALAEAEVLRSSDVPTPASAGQVYSETLLREVHASPTVERRPLELLAAGGRIPSDVGHAAVCVLFKTSSFAPVLTLSSKTSWNSVLAQPGELLRPNSHDVAVPAKEASQAPWPILHEVLRAHIQRLSPELDRHQRDAAYILFDRAATHPLKPRSLEMVEGRDMYLIALALLLRASLDLPEWQAAVRREVYARTAHLDRTKVDGFLAKQTRRIEWGFLVLLLAAVSAGVMPPPAYDTAAGRYVASARLGQHDTSWPGPRAVRLQWSLLESDAGVPTGRFGRRGGGGGDSSKKRSDKPDPDADKDTSGDGTKRQAAAGGGKTTSSAGRSSGARGSTSAAATPAADAGDMYDTLRSSLHEEEVITGGTRRSQSPRAPQSRVTNRPPTPHAERGGTTSRLGHLPTLHGPAESRPSPLNAAQIPDPKQVRDPHSLPDESVDGIRTGHGHLHATSHPRPATSSGPDVADAGLPQSLLADASALHPDRHLAKELARRLGQARDEEPLPPSTADPQELWKIIPPLAAGPPTGPPPKVAIQPTEPDALAKMAAATDGPFPRVQLDALLALVQAARGVHGPFPGPDDPLLSLSWAARDGIDLRGFVPSEVIEWPGWSDVDKPLTSSDLADMQRDGITLPGEDRGVPRPRRYTKEQTDFIRSNLTFLKRRRLVRRWSRRDGRPVIGSLSVVDRGNGWVWDERGIRRATGKKRMVLDNRVSNRLFLVPGFRQKEVDDWLASLTEEQILFALDIIKGFLAIHLHPACMHLFAFRDIDDDSIWVYCRLPFGASPAPLVFSAITALVDEVLRARSPQTAWLTFVDDFSGATPEEDDPANALDAARSVLAVVGFATNPSKTQRPARVIDVLGLTVDAGDLKVRVRTETVLKTASAVDIAVRAYREGRAVPRDFLRSLAGYLQWLATVYRPLRPAIRSLHAACHRGPYVELRDARIAGDLHTIVRCKDKLGSERSLRDVQPDAIVVTDAGDKAWAACGETPAGRFVWRGPFPAHWGPAPSSCLRELLPITWTAVKLASYGFKNVLAVTDSASAAFSVLKGSAAGVDANSLLHHALQATWGAGGSLLATWTSRWSNVLADRAASSPETARGLAQAWQGAEYRQWSASELEDITVRPAPLPLA